MLTHQPDPSQTPETQITPLDEAVAVLPDLTYTRPRIVDEESWEAAQEWDDTAQLLDDASGHWSAWTLGTPREHDTTARSRYLARCLRSGHVIDLSDGAV